MSVAYANEPMTNWDHLLEIWRELDVPEGYRPELTSEGIYMTPAPGGTHNLIADRVLRALAASTPDELGIFQTQGVGIEEAEAIYIPDFCVAPRAAIPSGSDPIPADQLILAVEITSPSNAERDRVKKTKAYARGGVPLFLLIDPLHESGPTTLVMSDPLDHGMYGRVIAVPFGEPIKLGEPFDVELDTSRF